MKAKIVIDMPENCFSCPLCAKFKIRLCTATDRIVGHFMNKRPDWCPLVPEKEKKYSDPNLCSECGTPYIGKFG